MKNNKKRGASSKTWAIDCRTDSAFDFALKVLREARNSKYPLDLRINFIRIAYSNSLETIAKAQTNPKEFKLKTALKLFNANLAQISKVALDIVDEIPSTSFDKIIIDVRTEYVCGTKNMILNPHDYVDINYPQLEDIISYYKEHHNEEVSESEVMNCYGRYNFPKIFEEISKDAGIHARLLPTNDIIISISDMIAAVLRVPLNKNQHYANNDSRDEKIIPFIELIEDKALFIPNPEVLRVPYNSFLSIPYLLKTAAENPDNVSEIGITIYRLSENSEIINALILAANNKIKCKIYVELSARGETDQDLKYLIQMLNNANRDYLDIKIQYNGIKVHAKMMYIAFKDRKDHADNLAIGIFSTGNYNESTSAIYKDYHYISCESNIVEMIRRNFAVLWNSEQPVLSSISNVLSKEIYEELSKGKDGRIWIQTNHLDNKHVVNLLREAIRRGCDVRLIVRTTRGFHNKELKNCKTIVGKYLEHARVYIFGDAKDRRVYLSSSDILFRNLYNRFESYVKITDNHVESEIIEDFKNLYKNGQIYV